MEFSFVNFTLVDIGIISVALLALLTWLRRRKSVSGEREAVKLAYEALKAAHEALRADHEALKADHEALGTAHEALKADHEALKAAHTAQTEEFEAYRQAADLRYRELQSTSDRRYNVLHAENAALQEGNADLHEENAALQKEVGEQRREIATQAGILEELKIGFHQLRGRYDEIKDLLTKLVEKL